MMLSGSQSPSVPSRAGASRLASSSVLKPVSAGSIGHADQLGQLGLQQLRVPGALLVAAVIHQSVGLGLGRSELRRHDHRHLPQSELRGGRQALMPGEDHETAHR